MTLLKVGSGIYVPADEIVLLEQYPSRPAVRAKQAAEAAQLYVDATTSGKKREKLRTLIRLRCGLVIGSPVGPDALAKRPPLETPVKLTTRGNNLDGACVATSDGSPAASGVAVAASFPIEHAAPAPGGRPFKAQEPAQIAQESAETDDNGLKADEGEKARGGGLRGLKRRFVGD